MRQYSCLREHPQFAITLRWSCPNISVFKPVRTRSWFSTGRAKFHCNNSNSISFLKRGTQGAWERHRSKPKDLYTAPCLFIVSLFLSKEVTEKGLHDPHWSPGILPLASGIKFCRSYLSCRLPGWNCLPCLLPLPSEWDHQLQLIEKRCWCLLTSHD